MEEFQGLVTAGPFARGSKSEHRGVFLETDSGRFVLRRPGGNPFSDPVLDGLVGRKISATGETHNYVLLLADWREIDGI
jgi:hypothetical protein